MHRTRLAQKLAVLAIPLLLLGAATAQAQRAYTPEDAARIRTQRAQMREPANPTGWPWAGTCTQREYQKARNSFSLCGEAQGRGSQVCRNLYQWELYGCGAVTVVP